MIFCRDQRKFAIAIVGAGNVGTTLLRQIEEGLKKANHDHGVHFQVKAIANSRYMLLSQDEIHISQWETSRTSLATSLNELTQHMESLDQESIIIDTTASPEVADFHSLWLEKGLNVITANKISCSSDQYHNLIKLGRDHKVKYLFETTVGAGLPVLHVARSLVDSGDKLLELQAILSGSLSYLFLELEKGHRFSDLIRRLKNDGFTEPDPRSDLSGLDVARKLIILGKQFDINVAWNELEINAVVPDIDAKQSADEFLASCEKYDDYFSQLVDKAKRKQQILRYVARLSPMGTASVRIESLPSDHAFANLNPADNIVQFTTNRYHANPLFVRGPGAGLAVTAAGLYNDMLKLAIN